MTRKHFDLLAISLSYTRPIKGSFDLEDANGRLQFLEVMAQWSRDVEAVAYVCGQSKNRFDHQRFIKACKGKGFDD